MSYKIHRFNIRMDKDQDRLEQHLNSLHGEVVTIIRARAIIPNVTSTLASTVVDFLLIVERLS